MNVANSYLETGQPSCAICAGDSKAKEIEENLPNLTNRKARCGYFGVVSGGYNKCSPIVGAFGHPELNTNPMSVCEAEIASDFNLTL